MFPVASKREFTWSVVTSACEEKEELESDTATNQKQLKHTIIRNTHTAVVKGQDGESRGEFIFLSFL